MKRKFLSLILVFAMTVSLLTVGTGAVEPTYGDTAGHWAESSIERWSAYGIIQGSNGQFDPNGQLTCAQLATILAKLLKLPAAKDAGFTDNTADAWYYDAINRCAAAGILNGNGDGTVTPEAPITRERAMVMLARALGIEPIRKPDLAKYTDAAQVSAYAQGYLAAMIKAGIVGGVGDNRLAPQDNITRASTVTILDRAIGVYADKDGMTVNAKDGELVLVVAKNVKVINAPEGTKIVVADDATGLTVNGKAVSDDQTYIVPKTTSSGSSSGGYSHSHSYDATSHKCSCGEFAPDVVATIGDTNGYLTLKAAVAAATNGATVKLVKGALLDADILISSKITLDLNGNTIETNGKKISVAGTGDLTVTGNGIVNNQVDADEAGGTMNRYTMLSVKEGGKLTIENGTFTTKAAQIVYTYGSTTIRGGTFKNTSTSEETVDALNSGALIVVCGTPASLTMTGGTVTTESQYLYGVFVQDGGNAIFGDEETKNGPSIHTHRYAAIGENNTMPTANITIYGGEYTVSTVPASDAWKPFCATIYASASGEINIHGGTFTGYYAISDRYQKVEQTVTITGGTFNGAEADLYVTSEGGKGTTANRIIAIAGGTFDHNPDATYIATGYVATANTNNTWTVREKADASFVAQIGGVKYTTLAAAITAAQNGDTVKLLANETVDSTISVNKNLKLDLGGKTLTGTSCRALHITGGKLELTGSGTVTSSTGINVSSSVIRVGDSTGSSRTAELVIGKDVVIEAPASYGVGAFGTVTTETLTIYGTVKSTTATNESYDGCAVTTLGTDTETPATIIIKEDAKISAVNTNAVYLPAGTLTVEGGEITGTTGIYFKSTNMTISGGTITGNGTKQDYKYYGNGGISTGEAVTIDSCNYPGGIGSVSIRGGEFSSTHANAIGSYNSNSGSLQTNFVTGGTFSSNPGAYVAEGYIAYQKDDGTYQVVKNAGTVNVSLSELNKIAITKGPKATGEKTSFTVDLGSERVAASDIAYSENNSGYTGKGVQIGSRSLNNYAAKPAKVGDYEFVIKGGTITSEATGYSSIDSYKDTSVYMLVPGNSNVTFEDVTFEGVLSFDIQKYTSPWSNLNSLTFKNCIFKGIIIGTCPASNVTFDHCKFLNYTNKIYPNNSNPIWWREDTEGSGANANPIKTFTFVNNEVVGTRPLKIERIGKTVSPTFTFKNNTFDISKQGGDTETKNMAINIGMGEKPNLPFTLIDEGNTISANTAALYTVAFSGSNSYKEVSGMKVQDGHESAKTITAMVWKTTTGETFELKSVD